MKKQLKRTPWLRKLTGVYREPGGHSAVCFSFVDHALRGRLPHRVRLAVSNYARRGAREIRISASRFCYTWWHYADDPLWLENDTFFWMSSWLIAEHKLVRAGRKDVSLWVKVEVS